jgi:predicted acetyltransferase
MNNEDKENIKLIPFKNFINKKLYEMYQDIPPCEIGSTNKLYNVSYDEFKLICKKMIEDEIIFNEEIQTKTKIFVLLVNDKPVGEVGIRTSLNNLWINKGSQIYYKIRKSERGKGYGNIILKLALDEARNMNFNYIRINCDNNNIPSKKVIISNGGKIDIPNYKTKDGYSTSYIIQLNK